MVHSSFNKTTVIPAHAHRDVGDRATQEAKAEAGIQATTTDEVNTVRSWGISSTMAIVPNHLLCHRPLDSGLRRNDGRTYSSFIRAPHS